MTYSFDKTRRYDQPNDDPSESVCPSLFDVFMNDFELWSAPSDSTCQWSYYGHKTKAGKAGTGGDRAGTGE
jgi:hypothetical protein